MCPKEPFGGIVISKPMAVVRPMIDQLKEVPRKKCIRRVNQTTRKAHLRRRSTLTALPALSEHDEGNDDDVVFAAECSSLSEHDEGNDDDVVFAAECSSLSGTRRRQRRRRCICRRMFLLVRTRRRQRRRRCICRRMFLVVGRRRR